MIVTVRKVDKESAMFSIQMPATEVSAYIELVKAYPVYDGVSAEECEFYSIQICDDGRLEIVVKGESD